MPGDATLLPNFYYVGNFDDEILRYNQSELTLETINDTLFQAVIAGGPLLINDGYLMHFPAGRLALTNPNVSSLPHLIKAGYVKLFSRNGGDLAGMPESMQHIPTYEKLVKEPDWPELKNTLNSLQTTEFRQSLVNWPRRDVGPGFLRLVQIARKNITKIGLPPYMDGQNVETLFNKFEQMMRGDPKPAARTTWNKLIDEPDLQFGKEAKEYLHWIGLEAYHYNMAMLASPAFGGHSAEDKHFEQPGVLTRFSTIFSDVRVNFVEADGGTETESLPRPEMPKGLYERAKADGIFLQSVVAAGKLQNLKSYYQSTLSAAMQDKHHLQEAKNAADEYGRALALALMHDHNGKQESFDWLRVPVASGLGTLGGLAVVHATAGAALMGAMVGLGVGELMRSAQETYHFVFQRQVPLAIHLIQQLEKRSSSLNGSNMPLSPAKWSAFMPVDLDQARDHFDLLPKF